VWNIVWLLVIAGVCGALGQAITACRAAGAWCRSPSGIAPSWDVARAVLGLPELFTIRVGGARFPILWSIIGSALFVAVISLITRSRR